MNSKYVTSLELSRKLKAAGVPQESEYSWYHFLPEDRWEIRYTNNCKLMQKSAKRKGEEREYVSAFHVGELGELLPKKLRVSTRRGWGLYPDVYLEIDHREEWVISYISIERNKSLREETDFNGNLAEAMGKMLLFLYQNKLIDPPRKEK